jgi:hypothetical protein
MVFGFGTFATVLFWSGLVIIVGGLVSGTVIYIFWRKSYKEKVVLFAKIGGRPQKIGEYPAKWIRVGRAGDKLLWVRNAKKWVLPTMRVGKNEWYFHVRERDGEWINIVQEDVDEKMKTMKVKFIDGDVRMQRLGIEKVLEKRHQGQKDWMKILANIGYVVVFVLLFIGLTVLFSKQIEVAEALGQNANAQIESAGAIRQMAESVGEFYDEKVEGQSPRDLAEGGGVLIPVE